MSKNTLNLSEACKDITSMSPSNFQFCDDSLRFTDSNLGIKDDNHVYYKTRLVKNPDVSLDNFVSCIELIIERLAKTAENAEI